MTIATAKHVAKEAGVSQITVSRTFSGKGPVAKATRHRVLEVAKRLQYQPNPVAVALRGAATGTIGILATEVAGYSSLHSTEVLAALDRQCQESSCRTLITFSHRNPERLQVALDQMAFHRIEGLIVFTSVRDEFSRHLESVLPRDLPLVTIGPGQDGQDEPGQVPRSRVSVDRAAGTARAVEQAWELGHREFAFATSTKQANPGKAHGIEVALGRLGGRWTDARIVDNAPNPQTIGRTVDRLLAIRPQPTCLLCSNDHTAVMVIAELQRRSLRVPADLSVIGFDDLWIHSMSPVPLTTIRQPRDTLAARALELLRQRIDDPDLPPASEMLQPELILRDSLGAVPASFLLD